MQHELVAVDPRRGLAYANNQVDDHDHPQMLGEQERTDADVHHGQAEVEALPQGNRPVLRAIHQCAHQRAEGEAGKHKARVLLHIRFGGKRDDGDARSRLERAQTEPGDAHRNQTRTPNGRLLARTRIGDRLLNGCVNRGLIGHAFTLKTAAGLLGGGFHLQRLSLGGLALTVFLAGDALGTRQRGLRRWLSGQLGQEHQRTDHHAHAGERERQQTGDHGQRGGQRITDHPHAFVEHAAQRQRAVRALPVTLKNLGPARAAHRAPRRNGGQERRQTVQHPFRRAVGNRRHQRDGGHNPNDNRRNRDLPLAELVGQLAQQRRGHGQRNRLNGGEHAGQRIVAVIMLYGNGDGHADHREWHAGDDRADGITGGMRNAQ